MQEQEDINKAYKEKIQEDYKIQKLREEAELVKQKQREEDEEREKKKYTTVKTIKETGKYKDGFMTFKSTKIKIPITQVDYEAKYKYCDYNIHVNHEDKVIRIDRICSDKNKNSIVFDIRIPN